ncbi:hypothetical protein R6L23_12615 [Streptomyces sp. SR27]|uniref:hypothetical protein n=1 Tax=Streptomyces sp. SR27 TaxID=3076630 RepID=UPI00295AB205|nr:hypothetical protein [Streptomyces sp. SR27]MDV9189045.1 hypothetical protein [Streptomyces sp. SR27]
MNGFLDRPEFQDGKRDKGRIRADAFKRDERMEALAELRDSRPEVFETLGTSVRMSLGYYENDKKIAAEHGRDVTKGSN